MDTPDDEDIALDTSPMSSPIRLWVQWRVVAKDVAPDVVVWLVCDGDHVQVPAANEVHAQVLCESMLFAEYACCSVQPLRWLQWTRLAVLRLLTWLNRCDPRRRY